MADSDRLRQSPVLLITDANETQKVFRALDLGVNDYIVRPFDENELRARVRTQLRRKSYQDRLRNMMSQAVEFAVTDSLTGLYNRRYLEAHLRSALTRAAASEKPVCLFLFDIDHFKGINDTHGHDAGDDVLRSFAERLRQGVRGVDLVSRHGGDGDVNRPTLQRSTKVDRAILKQRDSDLGMLSHKARDDTSEHALQCLRRGTDTQSPLRADG